MAIIMSTLVTLWHVLVAIYRLIIALRNAYVVLLQVVRSVIQEAKQEAVDLMALVDDGSPTLDAVTSRVLEHGVGDLENPWQMLIITRASSFVLLLRLSKRRILHLEVDERFISGKLEVIRTELMVHIEHVPRLLATPIGMHDTRLVRYTPMRLPYVWKETAEKSIVPAAPVLSVSAEGERRSHRKKYVQLLTESALRRRLEGKGVVKRRALADTTNGKSENSQMGDGRRKRGRFDLYGVRSEFSLLRSE